jgi:hypothetical protein
MKKTRMSREVSGDIEEQTHAIRLRIGRERRFPGVKLHEADVSSTVPLTSGRWPDDEYSHLESRISARAEVRTLLRPIPIGMGSLRGHPPHAVRERGDS